MLNPYTKGVIVADFDEYSCVRDITELNGNELLYQLRKKRDDYINIYVEMDKVSEFNVVQGCVIRDADYKAEDVVGYFECGEILERLKKTLTNFDLYKLMQGLSWKVLNERERVNRRSGTPYLLFK